jgi:hypothetical protein
MKKCWANSFGKCGTVITGEHLISKSILDKTVFVQGFSWCKDEPKEIGQASLVSNFLCNVHNSSLSPCDTEIAKFVSSISDFVRTNNKFDKHGFSLKKIPVKYRLSGLLIEKWFVKTLINICLTQEKDALIHFDKVLPFLYSSQNFENPFGLSFGIKSGMPLHIENKISILALFNDNNGTKELSGGLFTFHGFRIIVLIPCSKFPLENNQLKLSNSYGEAFEGLQLNWHNTEIGQDGIKGRKKVTTQKIIFSWD